MGEGACGCRNKYVVSRNRAFFLLADLSVPVVSAEEVLDREDEDLGDADDAAAHGEAEEAADVGWTEKNFGAFLEFNSVSQK